MVDKPPQPSMFDPAMLGRLACPTCHGDLRLASPHLLCLACGRSYPVVDGIPVMIIERAELPSGAR